MMGGRHNDKRAEDRMRLLKRHNDIMNRRWNDKRNRRGNVLIEKT